MTFAEDLAAATTAEPTHVDVHVLVNSNLHTLRFRPMDGLEWATETDRHPPRPNVLIDEKYGYNLRSLIRGAAPQCGVLVVDGVEQKLRVDGWEPDSDEPPVNEWEDLLRAVSGHDFQRITDVIWALNEYLPQQRIEAAGKALADSANTSA